MLSKPGERVAAALGVIFAISVIALADFMINGNWLAVFIMLGVAVLFVFGVRKLSRGDVSVPGGDA